MVSNRGCIGGGAKRRIQFLQLLQLCGRALSYKGRISSLGSVGQTCSRHALRFLMVVTKTLRIFNKI